MQARADELDESEIIKHIPWVAGRPERYYFVADPIVVDAAPDVVWEYLKQVERYHEYSHGAMFASLPQGELKVGNTIHLIMYPHAFIGHFIPASDERITVVDDEHHVLGWERDLACSKSPTECYRKLMSTNDGKQTIVETVLKIPGPIGFFTSAMMREKIVGAFNLTNEGLKNAAECRLG